jgi:bifunctional non-homologous end joining protein LigD
MALDEYRKKRDFTQTPEPSGDAPTSAAWEGWTSLPHGKRFCIQMHKATRMHWDLRLEHNGVLLSWPIPKGPSLDPANKRFAVHTEDHPIDYGDFEGVIPSGYGMGTVLLWDVGTYEWVKQSAEDPDRQLTKGDVKFVLQGSKIRGEFALVKIGGRRPGDDEKAWLLIKKRDDAVVDGYNAYDYNYSVRTGRTLEEISAAAGGDPRELRRAARTPKSMSTKAEPDDPPPPDFSPMLATPAEKPFSREGWFFELKYDGVRARVTVTPDKITVTGRSGRDETARYPEAQKLRPHLKARSAVLDTEIVALDKSGQASFERLQQRINISGPGDIAAAAKAVPATLVCFDILWLDGKDLTKLPLRIRKKTLRDVIVDGGPLLFADHVEKEGEAFFEAVSKRGVEGMIGKSADSTYQSGKRSRDWLKFKAWRSQSCVICGYTAGKGRRMQDLGALVLGVYEGKKLRWCGQVGTGFDAATLRNLKKQLDGIVREKSPIDPVPVTKEPVTWVEPKLVCEVRYSEVTSSGMLRHPAFLGLRTDVSPRDCKFEKAETVAVKTKPKSTAPSTSDSVEQALEELRAIKKNGHWNVGGRRVHVTNLDKVFWPQDGYTKRDLIEYYVKMAPYILPYLQDRPVGFDVYPDGISGKSFWRKAIPEHAPEWIETWTFDGERKSMKYVLVQDVATLAWVANSGAIDIHPWHSRCDAPDQPDWAVFDLDPFEPATFNDVKDIARLIKVALDHLKLKSLLKVSGQTGLQIYVPLQRSANYAQVRGWVEEIGRNVGAVRPDLITWEWAVNKRTGQIRIDYTQNIINKTLAAAYSARPAMGAPVSMPITWDELEDDTLAPDRWNISTAAARVAEVGDLFADVLSTPQSLPNLGRKPTSRR